MTNFAALRRTDTTSFTIRPRRHVVVVHVTLFGGWCDRVDHLVHARHGQGDHVQHLCFTTLEETRAVCSCQQADFRRHRTKITWAATIDANIFSYHALADQVLGE